jgi:hypothetical protein
VPSELFPRENQWRHQRASRECGRARHLSRLIAKLILIRRRKEKRERELASGLVGMEVSNAELWKVLKN